MGVSIGVCVAFLPTIGFQMGMALVLACALNVSRPAAIASVWITNPLTMGPVYTLAFLVGRPFWLEAPDIGLFELSQTIHANDSGYGIGSVFMALQSMLALGSGVLIPILFGGVLMGAIAGVLAYYPTYAIVSHLQRSRRRKSRRARRGLSISHHASDVISQNGGDAEVTTYRKAA